MPDTELRHFVGQGRQLLAHGTRTSLKLPSYGTRTSLRVAELVDYGFVHGTRLSLMEVDLS
jgi:hypothetical protein